MPRSKELSAVCKFEETCRLLGGCQYQMAIDAYFKQRRTDLTSTEATDYLILDSLTFNSGFRTYCPNFFEITSNTLDRIGDPDRYRRNPIKPRN